MEKTEKRPLLPLLLIAAGVIVLVIAAASLLLFSGGDEPAVIEAPSQDIPFAHVSRVDLSTAKSAFDAGEAVFVDIRDQVYYDRAHIPGARSIPLGEFESRINELDHSDWIILYCT